MLFEFALCNLYNFEVDSDCRIMLLYQPMRIIKLKHLRDYWVSHADAQPGLRKWAVECSKARWRSFEDVKAYARSADYVGNNRVVFNICGNKYRLVVAIHYKAGIVLIKFLGTHAEYDKIDVTTAEIGDVL